LITVIFLKPDCVDVNQLESLVQKVQGCILDAQLVTLIFSKQELRKIKRHLKYKLSFIMNLYMLFNARSFTSDDIEFNPGPVVTQGNNPINVIELLQSRLAQHGLRILDIGGGGDCFFRAVSIPSVVW